MHAAEAAHLCQHSSDSAVRNCMGPLSATTRKPLTGLTHHVLCVCPVVPVLDALALVPGLRIVNCNSELACAYAAGWCAAGLAKPLTQTIAAPLVRCSQVQQPAVDE